MSFRFPPLQFDRDRVAYPSLWRGCRLYFQPAYGLANLATGSKADRRGKPNTATAIKRDQRGFYADFTGAEEIDFGADPLVGKASGSIFCYFYLDSAPSDNQVILGAGTTTDGWGLWVDNNCGPTLGRTNSLSWTVIIGGTDRYVGANNALSANNEYRVAATHSNLRSANAQGEIWINGAQGAGYESGIGSTNPVFTNSVPDTVAVAAQINTLNRFLDRMYVCAAWDRLLTDLEIAILNRDPYAMIRQIGRTLARVPLSAAGSASITIPQFTIAASAVQEIPGAAALDVPVPSIAASAVQEIPGAAALDVPVPSIAASAFEQPDGAAALGMDVPSITASSSGNATATASLAVASIALAASGGEEYAGSADISLGPIAIAASLTEEFTSTGALAVAVPDISGIGFMQPDGAATVALGPFSLGIAGVAAGLQLVSVLLAGGSYDIDAAAAGSYDTDASADGSVP